MDERQNFIDQARLKIEALNDELDQPSDSSSPAVLENRYEIQTLLGEGAAGRVWKAYDRTLKRHVALKKLRLDDAVSRDRFLREARNQARVQNPNICKVFDVGEIAGEPYIAMHCVEGKTLSAASSSMTLREKVEVMRIVAEAVDAAHKSGLIHRDLKPGNILVEKTSSGWLPYVTDFGLARDDDAIDRTKTGMIIGTPAYMAPEQAQGNVREIDPRTDIYALGTTFYELLCGEPPFTGTSMEVVLKTVHEEAPSMRQKNAEIPNDLEIIVMKCLQKEPSRRYYSAQALADDLLRFLNGEPILARRASWHYRLGRKARRHRTVIAIAAMAFFIALFSGAFGIYNWWNASRKAELAQQFGQQVAQMEGFLRHAYSLPIHDIRKERLLAQQKMNDIRKQIERLGGSAHVPGNYALGRGYFALQEFEPARAHLQAAWNAGYRGPEVAYGLGRTIGALYQQELEALEQISNQESREARRRIIEKEFRDPALTFLKASKGNPLVPSDYVEALIAFYSNDLNKATALNEKAIRSTPLLFEARKLQGDIHTFKGLQNKQSGQYIEAKSNFDQAGEAYRLAADIARSDAGIYDAECQRQIHLLDVADLQGVLTETGFTNAIAACDRTLLVDPRNANAFSRKSQIYSYRAVNLRLNQGDPAPMYEKAIEMAKKALAIRPDFPEALNNLGNSYVHLSYAQWDSGVEREDTILRAIQCFQKSIGLKPIDASYCYLGDAYSDLAVAKTEKGENPGPAFAASIEAYSKAIQLNPRVSDNHSNLGMVLSRKAIYQLHHGQNPTQVSLAALEHYNKAFQLNPKHVWAYNNSGLTLVNLSHYEMLQSRSPEPHMNRAFPFFRRTTELNPKAGLPHLVTARGYILLGEYALQLRRDPSKELDAARAAIGKYIALSGSALGSRKDEASIELVAAGWAAQTGKSPRVFLQRAEQSLRKALEFNPEDAETYRRFAKFYLLSAKNKISDKKSASQDIERGLQQISEALKRDTRWGETYAIRAELLHAKIQTQREPEGQRRTAEEAKKAIITALELNKNLRTRYTEFITALNSE